MRTVTMGSRGVGEASMGLIFGAQKGAPGAWGEGARQSGPKKKNSERGRILVDLRQGGKIGINTAFSKVEPS